MTCLCAVDPWGVPLTGRHHEQREGLTGVPAGTGSRVSIPSTLSLSPGPATCPAPAARPSLRRSSRQQGPRGAAGTPGPGAALDTGLLRSRPPALGQWAGPELGGPVTVRSRGTRMSLPRHRRGGEASWEEPALICVRTSQEPQALSPSPRHIPQQVVALPPAPALSLLRTRLLGLSQRHRPSVRQAWGASDGAGRAVSSVSALGSVLLAAVGLGSGQVAPPPAFATSSCPRASGGSAGQ